MSEDNERKRQLEHLRDETPTKKPKVPVELSEDGPLTQRDVAYFKKEAIWRQMNLYKQKYNMLIKDFKELEGRYNANEEKLNALDLWYEQIVVSFSDDIASELLNDLLLTKLTSESSVDSILNKRRENLLKILTPLKKKLDSGSDVDQNELVKKVENLNSDLFTLKVENETLNKLKTDLSNKVVQLQQEFVHFTKEKNRSESKSLRRVDESRNHKEEEPEVKEEVEADPSETNINNEDFETLEVELNEVRTENQLIKEKLETFSQNATVVKQENASLLEKLNNLGESEVESSEAYLELKNSNSYLKESLSELQKINNSCLKKLDSLENNQNDIKKLINKDLSDENASLKSQLHKSEEDLIRIRAIRDELLAKQTIATANVDNKQTIEELNKLNQVLSKRIDFLESPESRTFDETKFTDMLKEELIKRMCMLQVEIKEIEAAFQETRELAIKKLTSVVDQESLIKKLTIEKSKADQKYFASMRSRDAITAENKVLKAQVSKSQDLINKFNELEASYINKIDVLTKSINDYKSIKQTSIEESTSLQEILLSLKQKNSVLEEQLSSSRKKFVEASNNLAEATTSLDNKDLTIGRLENRLKSTESLLKKYRANNTSSILQEDEKQLEALRSIAKCSVCSKNWKDTAITVCGHVFCNSCTQERLAARLRRCPTCNKGFSANDLLSIHL
ncbi:uncharacterized protein PRCAT00002413001 [Priceomyces carsonii]|uniref:uncharacterized protein n=1 Tax=Priceomyces carsonii TaxID=28549 RepID=UPI002EDBAD5A|nr:unnamed protein product [Priceomyces carsonii]